MPPETAHVDGIALPTAPVVRAPAAAERAVVLDEADVARTAVVAAAVPSSFLISVVRRAATNDSA